MARQGCGVAKNGHALHCSRFVKSQFKIIRKRTLDHGEAQDNTRDGRHHRDAGDAMASQLSPRKKADEESVFFFHSALLRLGYVAELLVTQQ